MRRIAGVAVLIVGALGGLIADAGPAAAATTTCTGTISNQTLAAVRVPAHGSCFLHNVKVNGDVVATDATELDVIDSFIKGMLDINDSANYEREFDVCGTTIQHGIRVRNLADDDEFAADGGPSDGDEEFPGVNCGSIFVKGNVLLKNNAGEVGVEGTSIAGNLTASGNADVSFEGNTVYGNRTCTNNLQVSLEEGDPDTVFGSDNCVEYH